ncbi:MAG: hypothetical protein N4A57_03640 [Anaeromicrobium sp.]|jgi:hypothetical protein|uniref:hypothetical protein n=1 Tax=Anaeromicrobium sp. TaxID=1929132 RepID=UPI0025F08239|nr:hypothetical protein [Anaeromicrobium sp.]MCT4593351.1 hypothetical protein [Anaeromicrobium sp.]
MGEFEGKKERIKNIIGVNKRTVLLLIVTLSILVCAGTLKDMGFNYFARKEIFLYLKKMQPIEKEFYNLMDSFMEDSMKKGKDNEIYSIEIKRILQRAYGESSNRYTRKNYELFIREIEKGKELIDYGHKEGERDKIRVYMENYFLVGESRNKNLIDIFEKYGISYIHMDGKIIYETK